MLEIMISVLAVLILSLVIAISLRRVVPTNMVHIVQSSKSTTPYGRGKAAGNTYYEFPSWVPIIGVSVTHFPESIFTVNLSKYEAYDSYRLPFIVDVVAFFRVDNAETAAHRVATFSELNSQLVAVVQGSVRRVLATNKLEDIMESRAALGESFTKEVQEQIKEWGVLPAKAIEFMDIKDAPESKVIANIMSKEESRITMESRIKIAENNQEAQLKEIDASRIVEVQKQDALQQVGIRTAQKDKEVGLANELSKQEIASQSKITTEKDLEVIQVQQVKTASIHKEVAEIAADQERNVAVVKAKQEKEVKIVNSEAEKDATIKIAEGKLAASKNEAEGLKLTGEATAYAERAMLMAPVDTQITLAKEIGENQNYQQYLITIKQVEAGQTIGVELAKALQKADLKVISNAGDPQSGVNKIGDLFTSTGGTNLTGMLSALGQSLEGKALLDKFTTIK